MKINESNISLLRNALEVSKILGIEAVMVSEGKIRGLKPSMDTAIISDLNLGMDDNISMGVGRVNDLLDRLNSFSNCSATLNINSRNEVNEISIIAPRTKMGYRCSSASMIKFPKSNEDPFIAEVVLTADEVKNLSKAVSVLGSEHIVFQMGRDNTVRVEASDAVNDRFEMVLENPGDALSDTNSFVFTYLAKLLSKILTSGTSDKGLKLYFGEAGSITTVVRDHNVIIFAQLSDDDYED